MVAQITKQKTLNTNNIKLITTNKFWWCLVFLLVFFSVCGAAEAATLYFSPSSGAYITGRNFTVSIKVSSPTSMNAASGVISFPTDKLEALSISKTGSIFNLWVTEPSFSNISGSGNIRFEGIVLNPGFTGDGKLLSVTFRNKANGQAGLNFSSGSVLANDGLGTNILSDLGTAAFTLSQGAVSAPETTAALTGLPAEPLIKHYVKGEGGEWVLDHDSGTEKDWLNVRNHKLVWVIPSGITGVSILLNDRPSSNPGSKSDGYFDSKTYEDLKEGVYYLHIRYLNASGAGPILHYKFGVDMTPPEPFKIILPDGKVTANPTPRIKFETTDKLSGIDRYEMKLSSHNGGEWFNTATLKTASYMLPKLKPGEHQILVRAYDKAGNYAEANETVTISPIAAPEITEYPSNIVSPGEKLIIRGWSLPEATIEIHMNKRSKESIIFNADADENGNWEAIYENIIPSGAYEVWTKQILDTGAESLQGQSVFIGVNSWFWRALQWSKNIAGFIVIALVFLATLAAAAYYFWHHFRIWRIKLRREVREAETAASKGFKKLRSEIKSAKPSRKILKDLSEIEKSVEKEIKDIEKK